MTISVRTMKGAGMPVPVRAGRLYESVAHPRAFFLCAENAKFHRRLS